MSSGRPRTCSNRTGFIGRRRSSTGDAATAALLEDLERVLLEIAHSPSAVSAKQLEDLRKQIEDRGILFKVKVFGTQVEQRQAAQNAPDL